MRILIFHGDLSQPSGGEVNARDWAIGFKERGHKVSMYSPRLGPLAQQIREHGITVADDPAALTDQPDVVMGSGVNELACLIARFPRAAGVQVAQLWDHWATSPSPLPQVVLHVAVDDINFEMLANEYGVPRERIRLMYNAVDMKRIVPRKESLPPRARRMLVFAKNQSNYMPAIKQACASAGIGVDFVGGWIGRPVADPLQIIHDYDIVFGSARTALEGAACGAAVIVGDGRGLAGMLTTSNYDHFRMHNFGREVLTRPLTADLIKQEIDLYDAHDASTVSDILRKSAGLDQQLEQLEHVFEDAKRLLAEANLTDVEINRSMSAYLARHLPRVAEGEVSPRHRPIRQFLGLSPEQAIAALAQQTDVRFRDLDTELEVRSTRNNAELTERLRPLFALADSVERNRPLVRVLHPILKMLRSMAPRKK